MTTFEGTHTAVPLTAPTNWTMYVSHYPGHVRRLVVFVHGFNGRGVSTWLDFPTLGQHRAWWQEADLLFVEYESLRDTISGVAHRVRREITRFYPIPHAGAVTVGGVPARLDTGSAYEELVLVGHSLGGLVLRRALCDAALQRAEDDTRPSPLLSGRVVLFSPASAGFQAAGLLGAVRATGLWRAVEVFLRRASAYSDLQPGSTLLLDTRRLTECLAADPANHALKARIVWANPDDVVIVQRYDTDFVDDSWDGQSHSSVCKPRRHAFEQPLVFVETGETS